MGTWDRGLLDNDTALDEELGFQRKYYKNLDALFTALLAFT
jgi:hypothetical protein